MSRAARPTPGLSMNDIERFNRMVKKGQPEDCWPWIGAKGDGYGRFKIAGKLYGAHRIAYQLARGFIPNDRLKNGLVLHSCHNPSCCNPLHLRLGTASENNMDSIRDGRWGNVSMNLPRVRRSKLPASGPYNSQQAIESIGGPRGTRTPNQTVMSKVPPD